MLFSANLSAQYVLNAVKGADLFGFGFVILEIEGSVSAVPGSKK